MYVLKIRFFEITSNRKILLLDIEVARGVPLSLIFIKFYYYYKYQKIKGLRLLLFLAVAHLVFRSYSACRALDCRSRCLVTPLFFKQLFYLPFLLLERDFEKY